MEDNGRLAGLSKEEMKASLKTLKDMASRLGATISILRERVAANSASRTMAPQSNTSNNNNNKEEKKVAEVLVKKLRKDDREDQDSIVDLRLAVTGAQDAGKSTLLGERISRGYLRYKNILTVSAFPLFPRPHPILRVFHLVEMSVKAAILQIIIETWICM